MVRKGHREDFDAVDRFLPLLLLDVRPGDFVELVGEVRRRARHPLVGLDRLSIVAQLVMNPPDRQLNEVAQTRIRTLHGVDSPKLAESSFERALRGKDGAVEVPSLREPTALGRQFCEHRLGSTPFALAVEALGNGILHAVRRGHSSRQHVGTVNAVEAVIVAEDAVDFKAAPNRLAKVRMAVPRLDDLVIGCQCSVPVFQLEQALCEVPLRVLMERFRCERFGLHQRVERECCALVVLNQVGVDAIFVAANCFIGAD